MYIYMCVVEQLRFSIVASMGLCFEEVVLQIVDNTEVFSLLPGTG